MQTGGQIGQKVSSPSTESSELIGIIAAMVILAFTFGNLVAMVLPIMTAIFALASTLAIIRLLGHVVSVPTVAPTLATMIGLGVGIDYALFIVTRHFRGMKDGLDIDESIARAVATSGGAVFFAGSTVTIALVSFAVAGIPLVTTMGLMAAIAVVVAVLGALTLLPAVLAITGPHINSLRVRRSPPGVTPVRGRPVGQVGARDRLLPVGCRHRRTRDPDPADDPTAVADSRPAGHGRALDFDHRTPGLRPDQQELRPGRQRPAADRGQAGLAGAVAIGSTPRDAAEGRQSLAGVAAVTPVVIDKAGTTAFFNAIATTAPSDNNDSDSRHQAQGHDDSPG